MAEYFTRARAEALLPRLTAALREIQALRAELAAREMELHAAHARVANNGHSVHTELETLPEEMADLVRRIADHGHEIAESGALIKDLEMGLLDFPALREGREVYLCWRLGEPRIAWWHEIETGLSGRQPLDDDAE